MKNTEKINEIINGLIAKADNKDLIEEYSELKVLFDESDKEFDGMRKDQLDLLKSYKQATLGLGNSKPTENPDETHQVSLEDIINDVLKK